MLENFDGAECTNDSNPHTVPIGNGIFCVSVSFLLGSLLENLIHHIIFNVVCNSNCKPKDLWTSKDKKRRGEGQTTKYPHSKKKAFEQFYINTRRLNRGKSEESEIPIMTVIKVTVASGITWARLLCVKISIIDLISNDGNIFGVKLWILTLYICTHIHTHIHICAVALSTFYTVQCVVQMAFIQMYKATICQQF